MNQAEVSKLVSKLRIKVRPLPRKLRQPLGPTGRLEAMRTTVTALLKYERIELNYGRADEARGYAERLISDAIRHGDKHAPTMESASFWLKEKQLVHKLFKVLVPRFREYQLSYTSLYKAPHKYPEHCIAQSVLELKGNPFPALIFDGSRNKNLIHNVLLEEARKEYRKDKYAEIAAKVASSEKEQQEQKKVETEKAAEEVSEGEQLLKSVSVDDSSHEKDGESDRSEFDDKPLPVV